MSSSLTIILRSLAGGPPGLIRDGTIAEIHGVARGGREVSAVVPTGERRKTAINKAAARKRLILTRYLGWAQGTKSAQGVTGLHDLRHSAASIMYMTGVNLVTISRTLGYSTIQITADTYTSVFRDVVRAAAEATAAAIPRVAVTRD